MKIKILAAFVALLGAGVAAAEPDLSGTIRNVYIFNGTPTFLFDLNTSNTTWAACNTYQRFAVSLSTPQGRAIYSQVLAAKLSGATVIVAGRTGTCNTDFASEDLGGFLTP